MGYIRSRRWDIRRSHRPSSRSIRGSRSRRGIHRPRTPAPLPAGRSTAANCGKVTIKSKKESQLLKISIRKIIIYKPVLVTGTGSIEILAHVAEVLVIPVELVEHVVAQVGVVVRHLLHKQQHTN